MTPALLLAAALAAAAPSTPATSSPRPRCLLLSESTDTEYIPVDDHTIVVRAIDRWWKLTTTPSRLLLQRQSILINDVHGPGSLCGPQDFRLSVLDHPGGAREGLIVQEFQNLSPQEGRALRSAARR